MIKKILNTKMFIIALISCMFIAQLCITPKSTFAISENTTLQVPNNIQILKHSGPIYSRVDLYWNHVEGAEYYEVQADGVIHRVNDINLFLTSETFSDLNLQPISNHSYKIRAKKESGEFSDWSETFNVITSPTTPIDITSKSKSNYITFNWSESNGGQLYELDINGVMHTTSANSFKYENLESNSNVSCRVRAFNLSGGYSDWSDICYAITFLMSANDIQAISDRRSISLTFKNIPEVTKYIIEDASGNLIGTTNTTVFEHKGLQPITTYGYRIRALGKPKISELVYFTTSCEYYTDKLIIPKISISLTGPAEIMCSFSSDGNATTYDIEKDGNVIGQAVVLKQGSEIKYTDTGFDEGATHRYRFRAVCGNYVSGWSDYVTVLGTPNIKVSSSCNSNNLITWNEILGADQYELCVDGNIITLNSTFYNHETQNNAAIHTYAIRAISSNKPSSWGKQVTTLSVPTNIKVQPYWLNTKASLSWDAVPGAQWYDIMLDGKIYYTTEATSYTTGFGLPFCSYTYKIRARTSYVEGAWSQEIKK